MHSARMTVLRSPTLNRRRPRMAGVSQALKRVKDDLSKFMPEESILAACRAVGHKWRERQLGPVQTIHLFILQVMACNTAMTHLRLLAGEVFSAAAFCDARARACRWRRCRGCCATVRPPCARPPLRRRARAPPRATMPAPLRPRPCGVACGRSWSTAPARSPPTPRPCKRPSNSRPTRRPAAASRCPSCWRCSTPSPAWSSRCSAFPSTPTSSPRSGCSTRC